MPQPWNVILPVGPPPGKSKASTTHTTWQLPHLVGKQWITAVIDTWKITREGWKITIDYWKITIDKRQITTDTWKITLDKLKITLANWKITCSNCLSYLTIKLQINNKKLIHLNPSLPLPSSSSLPFFLPLLSLPLLGWGGGWPGWEVGWCGWGGKRLFFFQVCWEGWDGVTSGKCGAATGTPLLLRGWVSECVVISEGGG